MLTRDDLEKLNEMKEQGLISQEVFDRQKADFLNGLDQPQGERKSQAIYVLLAIFFGMFGAHNFYAGRWKRGLAQLLITLLSSFSLFFISFVLAIINIYTIHTDKKGVEFKPCPKLKWFLWLIAALYLFIVLVGCYRTTRQIRQENAIVDYINSVYSSPSELY